jgi:hypothetical protein
MDYMNQFHPEDPEPSRLEQAQIEILHRIFIVTGLVLPWMVGLWVKIYLASHGRPTVPLQYFMSPGSLLIEAVLSAVFAIPFFVLARIGRLMIQGRFRVGTNVEETTFVLLLTYIAGVGGMIKVFIEVFWVFDPLSLIFGFVLPFHYAGYMIIGFLAGLLLVYVLRPFRNKM